MHPLFPARAKAYLVDGLGYVALATLLVPVGVPLRRRRPGRRLVLVLSAVPPVGATLLAAARESRAGTPGHRRERLVVLDDQGVVPSFGRALLRNAVKLGVPWQLGHVVALGAAAGGFERRDPRTLAATAVLYPWMAAALVAAATGSGRGLHDRVTGTSVRAVR